MSADSDYQLPMSLERPPSPRVLSRVLHLRSRGVCLCGGASCDEPAARGRRGLSESCYRAWHARLMREFGPRERAEEERRQIRAGRILWPEQGKRPIKKKKRGAK